MEIKGKVHCFFEQSGTFKNEFKKLGYKAFDYDIQNNFGQTDYVIDLFNEIEQGYDNKPSIFDRITSDDLIVAFFPCIYFTGSSNPLYFCATTVNFRNLKQQEIIANIIDRSKSREYFYELLLKLVSICNLKNIKFIFENPYDVQHYLHNNFIKKPSIIDKDRTRRGDYFKKPTGYWFFNCEPTYGESYQKDKEQKKIRECKRGTKAGLCSEERSMISPDYARNWICDFVLGKTQQLQQQKLIF